MTVLPQNVRARDGGVAAQVHFDRGRQPAQIEFAVAWNQKSSFREIHFTGDGAQPFLRPGLLEQAHGSRVSGEGNTGESVDSGHSSKHIAIPRETTVYFGSWLIVYMKIDRALRALANERRWRVLDWLKDPRRHFPPQVDGDLVKDGVCSVFIARKLRITQPSASEHLNLLADAGLIRGKKIKQWTFYKRNEKALERVKKILAQL